MLRRLVEPRQEYYQKSVVGNIRHFEYLFKKKKRLSSALGVYPKNVCKIFPESPPLDIFLNLINSDFVHFFSSF